MIVDWSTGRPIEINTIFGGSCNSLQSGEKQPSASSARMMLLSFGGSNIRLLFVAINVVRVGISISRAKPERNFFYFLCNFHINNVFTSLIDHKDW